MSTKPSSRSLTSLSAIFSITTRSRSALGSTLLFFGAETWASCPRLLGHPQNASARTAVDIGGDAQPTRACCWWRIPDHTWRVWRTEERRWEIKWRWTWNTTVLVSRWRQQSLQPPAATAAAPSAAQTADGKFWSRGGIRRRYQRRRVASRRITALAQRLGASLSTVRAKGPRGQDLQGTAEIRRNLRHLLPVGHRMRYCIQTNLPRTLMSLPPL